MATTATLPASVLLVLLLILDLHAAGAWSSSPLVSSAPPSLQQCRAFGRPSMLLASTAADAKPGVTEEREDEGSVSKKEDAELTDGDEDDDDDDDDDEFEYVEYDILTEEEFRGSEWAVGTVFGDNVKNVKETWARLVTDESGKNVAVWGDDSKGTWSLDAATQFFSMSKDKPWSKDIWAGVIDDYYYLQGTVRGWSFITPASVVGQWQARRLGVDPDEAGPAPWADQPEEASASNDDLAAKDTTATADESPKEDSSS